MSNNNNNKSKGSLPILIILSVIAAIWFVLLNVGRVLQTDVITLENMLEVPYTEFLQAAEYGTVDTIYYCTTSEYMCYTLYTTESANMTLAEREDYKYKLEDYRKCLYPASTTFREEMLKLGVNMKVDETLDKKSGLVNGITIITSLLSLLLPLLMLILIIRFFTGMGKGGGMGGLAPVASTVYEFSKKTDVKFSDVIGHEEVIQDIQFLVKVLKSPDTVKQYGVRAPKGILFTGPPGTGKTLIAKAIAGEAGVGFIYMNASSFIEMFVGVGAKRVRELFKKANESAPCIIFIDEIDAIGRKRTNNVNGSSEDLQTLNALLQAMDGFTENKGVLVIAATNAPETLDKALTRAGRFDREIVIPAPKNWKMRHKLFEHFTKNFNLAPDVSLSTLAKETSGFTGADIEAVCNEAGLIALANDSKAELREDTEESEYTAELVEELKAKNLLPSEWVYDPADTDNFVYYVLGHPETLHYLNETGQLSENIMKAITGESIQKEREDEDEEKKGYVTMAAFEEAVDKRILKGNRSRNVEQKERELVAWHEAGHAVMSYLVDKPIARATIVGTTSGVGGFVLHADREVVFETKENFETDILIAYAGRASEEIRWGAENISTGASSDIQNATMRIEQYVSIYGFDTEITGMLDIRTLTEHAVVDSSRVYERMVELSKELYERTKTILSNNMHLVDKLAETLLVEETIAGSDISKLLDSLGKRVDNSDTECN